MSDWHAGGLQELLDGACRQYAVPGAQVGLLHGADRIVVCSGVRSVERADPVTPEIGFHAGSLAKSLVGLVVLDAARRGDLDLDLPCDQQAAGTWPDTPRAILSQVTGRPNLLPEADEELEPFVARVAELPLVHPPGRFSYCNAGWPALDLLLRRRLKHSFEELAEERILGAAARFGTPAVRAHGHGVDDDYVPRLLAEHEFAPSAAAAGSRWWATADGLLDLAGLHLGDGQGRFAGADVRDLHHPYAEIPGATMADAWGLGWAVWDRGAHRAYGWAGMTSGHRAYLRCFPDQQAAIVVLANSAGPLFGPPGGSALFDALLPDLLEAVGVPALPYPDFRDTPRPAAELAGSYGPVTLTALSPDAVNLDAAALGLASPMLYVRWGGNTFIGQENLPGGMSVAVNDELLYVGPFAMPRTG